MLPSNKVERNNNYSRNTERLREKAYILPESTSVPCFIFIFYNLEFRSVYICAWSFSLFYFNIFSSCSSPSTFIHGLCEMLWLIYLALYDALPRIKNDFFVSQLFVSQSLCIGRTIFSFLIIICSCSNTFMLAICHDFIRAFLLC